MAVDSMKPALGCAQGDTIVRDDGMTLIEIVVATAILFFVVTAVFGLIMTSTNMSVSAKQQNVAINASNSYMEQVRSIPYSQVGVPGQSVVGSLTVETSSVVSGFNVSIIPTVTWVDDPNIIGPWDYKRVDIVTSVTPQNGGRVISRTFTTYVRENTDMQVPLDWRPPSIVFVSALSPSEGQAVTGSSVQVQVIATSNMSEGTIQDVSIRCDTARLIGSGTDGVVTANWGGLTTKTRTLSFNWNTEAALLDGTTLRDGPHWLVASVVDSIGQTTEVRIQIFIDNYAPTELSGAPTAVATSNVASTVSWGKAWDPDGPTDVGWDCWGYGIELRKQPTSAATSYTSWPTAAASTVVGQVSYPAVTTGLSRYRCLVTPVSQLGRTGPAQDVVWITPPLASGTYAEANGNKDVKTVITLSAPTFENSARTYTLYRATSATGPWTTTAIDTNSGLSATGAYTYTETFDDAFAYYYRARVSITPSGLGDLTPVTVWSNVVGPNADSKSGALPNAGW